MCILQKNLTLYKTFYSDLIGLTFYSVSNQNLRQQLSSLVKQKENLFGAMGVIPKADREIISNNESLTWYWSKVRSKRRQKLSPSFRLCVNFYVCLWSSSVQFYCKTLFKMSWWMQYTDWELNLKTINRTILGAFYTNKKEFLRFSTIFNWDFQQF